MSDSLPDLRFDDGALEPHVQGRRLELHHDKHHGTDVKGLNYRRACRRSPRTRGLRVDRGPRGDVRLQPGRPRPALALLKEPEPRRRRQAGGELGAAIDEFFGSFETLGQQLSEAATTVQGSGWGALAWEPVGRRLVVEQISDHQGNIGPGSLLLLVIDAWEHAYYLPYRNRKGEYAEAVWNVVNWRDVEERFARCRGFELV